MAAGAAMLANTMTAAPVSTILFSVCLNIFDPLSSRISVVTHVTCEANIAVAGTRGDQPMGWLSTVERMRFCINRSVESMDTNRYKKHHHLVQKLTPSSELGSYRYRIHRISEKRRSRKLGCRVAPFSATQVIGPGFLRRLQPFCLGLFVQGQGTNSETPKGGEMDVEWLSIVLVVLGVLAIVSWLAFL